MVALPVPDAVPMTCSQVALLAAAQVHELVDAVMLKLPLPPPAATVAVGALIV